MKDKYIDEISKKVEKDISNFNKEEDLIEILSQIFKALSDPTHKKLKEFASLILMEYNKSK